MDKNDTNEWDCRKKKETQRTESLSSAVDEVKTFTYALKLHIRNKFDSPEIRQLFVLCLFMFIKCKPNERREEREREGDKKQKRIADMLRVPLC